MYQDLSLRFYRSGPVAFEIYTHYLYEKIFGEPFLRAVPPETLEEMRQRFHERYKDRVHSLVRLTEAQNPFFDGLDDSMPEYRAVQTPVLLVAGSQDRVLPLWQQKKMLDVFPDIRFELVEGAGHVVYLEKKEDFFPLLKSVHAGQGDRLREAVADRARRGRNKPWKPRFSPAGSWSPATWRPS